VLQDVPTDEGAGQGKKRFMDVGSLLITKTQAAKLIQPREGTFHDPPPSAQSTAMFGVALCEPGHDVAGAQTLPDCLRVITTVAYDAIRTTARTSLLSL
jgi:hypothetical protein